MDGSNIMKQEDLCKQLKGSLRKCIARIPLRARDGSWNDVQDFKKWVGEAKKALNNPRSTSQTLNSLINDYDRLDTKK